ncbi:polynucleotide 5'-hydroxyl-kinase NOL9-like [Rhopilema esculentum]|uniref:polynucleotide 5'-hydroxyl-kinase NOL9-like n=1 Tax=Rhopilema esculentum TaxID=499914 RepID=UPI0031DEE346
MGKSKGKKTQNQKKVSKEIQQVTELKSLSKVAKAKSKKKQEKPIDKSLKDFRFSQLVVQPLEETTPYKDAKDRSILHSNVQLSTHITKKHEVQETPRNGRHISKIQERDDDVMVIENSFANSDSDVSENEDFEIETTKEEIPVALDEPKSDSSKVICYTAKANDEGIVALVVLNDSAMVPVSGKCLLHVIKGQLEIFGNDVSQLDQPVPVFCSKTSALYLLQEKNNCKTRLKLQKERLAMLEKYFNNNFERIKEEVSLHRTAVLLKTLSSFDVDFCCSHKPFQHIFVRSPEVGLTHSEQESAISVAQWKPVIAKAQQLLQKSQDSPFCILLCGNKNTGKSTFSRFLTNSFLKSSRVVLYLDCDLGQSEFTPPGLISLTKVDTPLIGPPFTHQRKPIASWFFGNTTPKDDPSMYIRCIQEAFRVYIDDYCSQGLLIVNTQGWMKGLGLSLLADVIRIVRPALVLQFRTQTETDRGFSPLSDDWVRTQPGWVFDSAAKESDGIASCIESRTEFHIVDTPRKEGSENQKLKAVDYRKLSLLAYFARMYRPNDKDLAFQSHCCDVIERPFLSLVPRIVYWKDVAVHVAHSQVPPSMILASLNFSLVSLAYVNPGNIIELPDDVLAGGPKFLRNSPIAEHIGYGFIRNIDIALKAFFILTPAPFEELSNVNSLIKGNIGLPVELLSKDNITDSYYFTREEQSEILGTRARKPRFNLKRRKFDSPMTS